MAHEEIFQTAVVSVLFVTTIAQATIHSVTWWALGPPPMADELSAKLRRREGSLAMKAAGRAAFEFLLLMLVVRGALPFSETQRDVLYVMTALLALYALWRGIDFVLALRNENWGRPVETQDERDRRQEATQKVLDETSLVLAKRGNRLSRFGYELDKKVSQLAADRRGIDKREHDQDVRDEEGEYGNGS